MSKPIKLYVRVAQGRNRRKAAANVKPSYYPLTEMRNGFEVPLPTAMFALELNIPDQVFKRAEHVAATVDLDPEEGVIVVPVPEPKTP